MDALRGIAAILVVYAHAVEFRLAGHDRSSSAYLVWHSFNWGTVGVATFFCISGFVIPYSFRKQRRPALGFVISRIARLYPAYWCSILAAIAAARISGRPGMPAITLLANATMVQRFFGQPDAWGVYWTLLIELIFYAVCLAAFLLGWLSSNRFFLTAALLLLTAAVVSQTAQPALMAPELSLSLMLLACLWRQAVINSNRQAAVFVCLGIAAWLAVLILISGKIDVDGSRVARSWILGVAIFAFSSALRVHIPGVLIFLGTISYGIYLYHELVSGAAMRLLPAAANAPVPGFVATALGSVAIAGLSYKLIEHPCIRLGKRLAEQPSSAPSDAQAERSATCAVQQQ